MFIKFTTEYLAGIFTGAGAAIFFLGLAVQSDIVAPDYLAKSGCLFAGLALMLGGGGMKLRSQGASPAQKGDS